MPHYFFNLRDGDNIDDFEGSELPDVQSARRHAIDSARALMADSILRRGHIALHHRIEITTDDGSMAEVVFFRDAVEIEP